MAMSIFGGFTDYSHQSFEDMIQDLNVWIENTSTDIESIKSLHEKLINSGYWDKVDYDFKALVCYACKFFLTALSEMKEILNEIQLEVRPDHYKRLKTLGRTAIELNQDFGKIWHQNYKNKEYGNPQFRDVEQIYQDGRDRAVSLQDLTNLAARIEDFIGKKSTKPPDGSQLNDEYLAAIKGALWVLESYDESGNPITQGTGFMVADIGVVTCSHVLSDKVIAFQPMTPTLKYEAKILKNHPVIDLAILSVDCSSGSLEIGDSDRINIFEPIVLAGFPNYRLGDSGVVKTGKICGTRNKSGIKRFMVDASIICGNSGGPILDGEMKVIGVAVTGSDKMETADETEDHGVIPINAIQLLP